MLTLICSPSIPTQLHLLEVQDYLENSCDPELGSPTTRNTTGSVLDIPEKEQTEVDNQA